jgi:3-(3-hydroxy-phenyl)propionate hydroxylase
VAADGGRGSIRKLLGIGFPGTDATVSAMIADVKLDDPPDHPMFGERRGNGNFAVLPFFEPGMHRVITTRPTDANDRKKPATFAELRETFTAIAGTDYRMHSPTWVSRFNDAARLVERYRHGRVFLAGDAAHIHYPAGGQGLNTGVQDAVNLGWKLAAVLNGHSDDALLDTYHAERHPVAERVLNNTRAQTTLGRPGPHVDALRDIVTDLVTIPEVNDRLGHMITALDIRYAIGDAHPLIGRRVPDADLDDGTRVFTHLRAARPVLLALRGDLPVDNLAEGTRIDLVRAQPVHDRWGVPGLGAIDAPAGVLIRPDGHVAWAGETVDAELKEALETWC